MRAHVFRILLAFGIWFGGASAHLLATERVPVDVYDYTGRFRLGQDGVITFFVTCGDLYMSSLAEGIYSLNRIDDRSYETPGGEFRVYFHSIRLVEITGTKGSVNAMAVRMAEGEKVPREYILEGNYDEAIRAYLAQYEKDAERKSMRSEDIRMAADKLREEGKVDEALMLMGLLSLIYPDEPHSFRGLGDVYLSLAITNYREYSRLQGEPDTKSIALEYLLEKE